MPSFRLTDYADAPLPGATVAFVKYCDRFGVARTPPAIHDHGDGLYSFNPAPGDVSDGVGYLIDCGAGSSPPKGAGFVGNAHVFFAGYDVGGAFNALLTPVITLYQSNVYGNLIPVPNVSNLGDGLYAFTPSASDRIAGARYSIDLGAAASPGRYVGGDLGDGVAPVPVGPPIPPGPIDFSSGSNTATAIKRALFFDPVTLRFPRQNGAMIHLTGRDSIAQAVRIRLSTLRGEWYLAINRGLPYFDSILVKAPDLKAIEQLIRTEIESVPGIKSVKSCALELDRKARKLSVKWLADSDFGIIEQSELLGV